MSTNQPLIKLFIFLKKYTDQKINKFVYWTPRIMSIMFILFLALFSLDVFSMNLGFWGTIGGLLMHNIPVFILITVLVIAWKQEIVGAIAFFLAGLLYIALLLINIFKGQGEWYMLAWSIQIAGPAFLIGFLFYKGWLKKRKNNI